MEIQNYKTKNKHKVTFSFFFFLKEVNQEKMRID